MWKKLGLLHNRTRSITMKKLTALLFAVLVLLPFQAFAETLLGATTYDPAGAVSKSTATLIAMTAFDTANLRLTVTVPAHGCVRIVEQAAMTGATTQPTVLLGTLVSATVTGRMLPQWFPGTLSGATVDGSLRADFIKCGLTPGSTVFDAAYAVQVVVASTNIKYGGPNDATGNDAWGGFYFAIYDPQPFGATSTLNLQKLNIVNSAGDAIVASSTGGNGNGINTQGNGPGSGFKIAGGSTGPGLNAFAGGGNTDGAIFSGSGNGEGLGAYGGSTGGGMTAVAGAGGIGAGMLMMGGNTGIGGNGLEIFGQGSSSGGAWIHATNGVGVSIKSEGNNQTGMLITGNGTASGMTVQGGVTNADGAIFTHTGTGADIRGNITGNITGNVSGSVGSVTLPATNLTNAAH